MNRLTAAAVLAMLSATAQADPTQRADEIYAAAFADVMTSPDEKHRPELDRSYAADLRFGYHAEKHWGYEMRMFYGPLEVRDAALANGNRSGIGGDAIYRLPALLGVRPYFLAGVGIAYSDALPGRDSIAPYVNAGAGLASGNLIELWRRGLRLRAEVRYAYEDYRDEYTGTEQVDRSNYADVHAFFGLEFALTPRVPEPLSPPTKVVPPAEPSP